MSVIPEKYTDLLKSKALVHVATIGPKGEPQSNPVWFGWDGTHILFSQTKGRQKYRNLQREPVLRCRSSILRIPSTILRFVAKW